MKTANCTFAPGFHVVTGDRHSQAATMVIAPGDAEGGPDNNHSGADQWLFVIDGTGEAIIDDRTYALTAGSLVLIQRGERHEIRNTGDAPLKTLNVYVPPAYSPDGDELPPGKPG